MRDIYVQLKSTDIELFFDADSEPLARTVRASGSRLCNHVTSSPVYSKYFTRCAVPALILMERRALARRAV